MNVRQTQPAESKQSNYCHSDHQALHQAREPDANEIDSGTDPDQSQRTGNSGNACQCVEIPPKPKGYVSTDEDVRTPVPPAHQEAPMWTKQCPCEGVSPAGQGDTPSHGHCLVHI